jgi:methylated-DNA-[protein]-cysteine S-methyltransferase
MSKAAPHYHVFDTAMGFCTVAWSDAGVVRFQLPVKGAEAAERLMRRCAYGAEPGAPPEDIAAVVAAAKWYFAGEETDFSHVRLDLAGEDPFFTQIYAALRTTTYGALAKEIGRDARARATSARRWLEKPSAVDHSLSSGAGRRRQNRRFLRARRLEDEDAHAQLEGVRVGPPEADQPSFSF